MKTHLDFGFGNRLDHKRPPCRCIDFAIHAPVDANQIFFRSRYIETDIYFAFLTDLQLIKNSYQLYCDVVRNSSDYRCKRLKLFFEANRIRNSVFQKIRHRYGNDNFSFLDPFMRTMFKEITSKRWPTTQRKITFKGMKYIGYPPVSENIEGVYLVDLLKVELFLSNYFSSTHVEHDNNYSIIVTVFNCFKESRLFQIISRIYYKIINHSFFYVIESRDDSYPKSHTSKLLVKPRKKVYNSRSDKDKPRKVYAPRSGERKKEDTPRKVYAPRSGERKKEDTPRSTRSDKGSKRKQPIDDNIENINFDAKTYSRSYNIASCFEICCVCGHEDSCTNMREKSNYDTTRLSELFNMKIEILKDPNTSNQEKAYIEDLKVNLPNGVLSTSNKVCISCTKHLNSKLKKSNPKGTTIKPLNMMRTNNASSNKYYYFRYPTQCITERSISRNYSSRTGLLE